MRNFKVYICVTGMFDNGTIEIDNVETVQIINETSIVINGVIKIDFGNEILGISEVT